MKPLHFLPHAARIRIEPRPASTEAGGEIDVEIFVEASCDCDFSGDRAVVVDAGGTRIGECALEVCAEPLAETEGLQRHVGVLRLAMPPVIGVHDFTARLIEAADSDIPHDVSPALFQVEGRAHRPMAQIWGLPATAPLTSDIEFTLALKCPLGCPIRKRRVTISDAQGRKILDEEASFALSPGSEALYATRIRLPIAGVSPGLQVLRLDLAEGDALHPGCARDLPIAFVGPLERVCRIRVRDAATGEPVAGAHALLHPFRALTDASGEAALTASPGRHRLHVSGFHYQPATTEIDLKATDAEIEIALQVAQDHRPY